MMRKLIDRDSRARSTPDAGAGSRRGAASAASRTGRRAPALRRLARTSLAAMAGCLLMVQTASALYVETAAPIGQVTSSDLQIGDHSISVVHEMKNIEIRNDEIGIRLRFKVAFKTIEFDNGPVMLNRIEFESGQGRALASSADGALVVTGGEVVDKMVSKLRIAGRSNVLAARGIHVEIARPVATAAEPIPEPGAALLFAAGLLAVGFGTRSRV